MQEVPQRAEGREPGALQASGQSQRFWAFKRVTVGCVITVTTLNFLMIILGASTLWWVLTHQVQLTADDIQRMKDVVRIAQSQGRIAESNYAVLQQVVALEAKNGAYIEQLVGVLVQLKAATDAVNVQQIRLRNELGQQFQRRQK